MFIQCLVFLKKNKKQKQFGETKGDKIRNKIYL